METGEVRDVSAAEGDREFIDLYREAAPAIYAWARIHILPPLQRRIDPEDVLQEVCARAFVRFESFDPGRAPFRAWLFGFAHNVLREALRSLKTRGESVFMSADASTGNGFDRIADDATSVTSRVAREEALQTFIGGVAELEEDERRLLLYRGLEGRKHGEVAEVLGITRDNAEKRWQRLRSKLQKQGAPAGLLAE